MKKQTISVLTHTEARLDIEVEFPTFRKRVMTGIPVTGGFVMVYYKILSQSEAVTVTTNVDAECVFREQDVTSFDASLDGSTIPFYGQSVEFVKGEGRYASSENEFNMVVQALCNRLVQLQG